MMKVSHSIASCLFLLVASASSFPSSTLPAFATDYTEVAISAIIELGLSISSPLHLALFLVGKKALVYMPQMPFLAMNISTSVTSRKWKKVALRWRNESKMWNVGKGKGEGNLPAQQVLNCRFRHSSASASTSFFSKGTYIPSNTSEDSGFNRMIEVLRCQIDPNLIPSQKHHTRGKTHVDILNSEGLVLFHFHMPWRTRQLGYGFRHTRSTSSFDAWRRHYSNKATALPSSSSSLPSVHLCSPAIRPLEPHRKDPGLPTLLEFVEHNLFIGVDHQFLGVFLEPRSNAFEQIVRLMNPYIQSGKVSIASMALKGVDDASGFLGAMLIDDYARIIHDQQCLYFSKGVSDYVYIAHATEFLTIRKPPLPKTIEAHESSWEKKQLPILLHNIEGMERSRSPSHQSCVHVVQAYGVPDPEKPKNRGNGPGNAYFLTDYYKDAKPVGPLPAWIVLLVPTDRVWLVAWHVVAACGSPIGAVHKALYRDITKPISRRTEKGLDVNILDVDDVMSYFYRGHFEPWQMSRGKQSHNYHLDIYKQIHARHRMYGGTAVEIMSNLTSSQNNDNATSLFSQRKKSRNRAFPVGKKALISQGWQECSHPCKNFMDLLLPL